MELIELYIEGTNLNKKMNNAVMKQLLLSIILLTLPMVANADPVEIEGVYYN